jgi:hypothetical protein
MNKNARKIAEQSSVETLRRMVGERGGRLIPVEATGRWTYSRKPGTVICDYFADEKTAAVDFLANWNRR